jgi:hypothetical protein
MIAMVIGAAERKSLLWWGLLLASIPAILFLPAFALFTICPPQYGPVVMTVILIAFAASEVVAGWKLARIVRRPLDWMSGGAIVGLLVALIILMGVAWGFMAPYFARRAGY